MHQPIGSENNGESTQNTWREDIDASRSDVDRERQASVDIDMGSTTEDIKPLTNQKEERRKKGGKPKEVVTFKTHLTSLALVCVIIFVYVILKLSFRWEFEFFTWHPVLLALGYMLLMSTGFFAINKNNTYWRKKTTGTTRVRVHFISIGLGFTLSVIGFIVVYINKNNLNKNHFVSWHGLFGVIALASSIPPLINGTVLLYKKELANIIKSARLVKFVHVLSGCLSFVFGSLALLLSPYTNWFRKRSEGSTFLFWLTLLTALFSLFWAVYGPVVKLVNVIKEKLGYNKEE